MKFAKKNQYDITHHLKHVAALSWEIKKCKFSADIRQIWKKMQTNYILTVLMNTRLLQLVLLTQD